MVQRRYTGIHNPKEAFLALKPYDQALIQMMQRVKPMGPDYLVLEAARKALDTAAYHFTREPGLYAGKPLG